MGKEGEGGWEWEKMAFVETCPHVMRALDHAIQARTNLFFFAHHYEEQSGEENKNKEGGGGGS